MLPPGAHVFYHIQYSKITILVAINLELQEFSAMNNRSQYSHWT